MHKKFCRNFCPFLYPPNIFIGAVVWFHSYCRPALLLRKQLQCHWKYLPATHCLWFSSVGTSPLHIHISCFFLHFCFSVRYIRHETCIYALFSRFIDDHSNRQHLFCYNIISCNSMFVPMGLFNMGPAPGGHYVPHLHLHYSYIGPSLLFAHWPRTSARLSATTRRKKQTKTINIISWNKVQCKVLFFFRLFLLKAKAMFWKIWNKREMRNIST